MGSIDFECVQAKPVKTYSTQNRFVRTTHSQDYCISGKTDNSSQRNAYNTITCVIKIIVKDDAQENYKAKKYDYTLNLKPDVKSTVE